MPDKSDKTESEIQAALDRVRAEQAEREATAAAAEKSEADKVAKLNAAKAVCAAVCAPIEDKLAVTTDPREREALIDLEHRLHADHEELLTAAYFEFTGERQSDAQSHQAPPGVTEISSHVLVRSEASA